MEPPTPPNDATTIAALATAAIALITSTGKATVNVITALRTRAPPRYQKARHASAKKRKPPKRR